MIRRDSLADACDRYSTYRSLRSSTTYQMRRGLALYSEFLGRPATVEDLSEGSVSGWLAALSETHAAPTVAVHRTNLLTLWRDLADQGLCNQPGRIRRCRRPPPCPVSWTRDELRAVLVQIATLEGQFRGGPDKRTYCQALVHAAYDTGLRRSDLRTLRMAQIRPDGSIVLRQLKTGQPHQPRVRTATKELLNELHRDPPLACPYQSESAWYRWWRQNVTLPAGVRHGCLQQLRRTGATHLAIEHPEEVSRYLGHSSPEMKTHYVDQSIALPLPHLPPEIA